MYVCALAVMQYFEISYLLNFVNLLPVMQQHFWWLANCNMQRPPLTFSHGFFVFIFLVVPLMICTK